MNEDAIQRQYYSETAGRYHGDHVHEDDEHSFALAWMLSILDHYSIQSILDVGSGTGRVVSKVIAMRPDVHIVGVEPVKEMRAVAYRRGISQTVLVHGDARQLQFSDAAFDLVCAFGVMHHVKSSNEVVAEMLRVARRGVFISDSNNFGQGSSMARVVKQVINSLGLWKIADWIKTKGKGYTISEGDGLAYSYSVYNSYPQVRQMCSRVHLVNTSDGGINHYRTAGHVALLGIK